MKAIILAAGEGTRLRPYTMDKPKCLVEIDGETLLDRQIKILKIEGITQIILIGGYHSEMLDGKASEIRINPIYDKTNMVYSLFCAEGDFDDEAIVSYGDIVYSKSILNKVINSKSDIAVAIDKDWESYWRARNDNPLNDAETLKLTSDNRITEIGQKPNCIDEVEGQYMGLMKFSKKGFNILRKIFYDFKNIGTINGKSFDKAYMTDLLQAMIKLDIRIDAVPISGNWIEIDTVDDLNSEITKDRLRNITQ